MAESYISVNKVLAYRLGCFIDCFFFCKDYPCFRGGLMDYNFSSTFGIWEYGYLVDKYSY